MTAIFLLLLVPALIGLLYARDRFPRDLSGHEHGDIARNDWLQDKHWLLESKMKEHV